MLDSSTDLTLNKRVNEFRNIISGCEWTNHIGKSLAVEDAISEVIQLFTQTLDNDGQVFVIGNGGSAAIASHAVNDLVNAAGIRAQVLHDPSLLTCLTNDYGYVNSYARAIDCMARDGDMLIAISSSGQSENILEAIASMRKREARVLTLSGFEKSNPLRQLGDINAWLGVNDYGLVEVGHMFLLHNISDRLVVAGKHKK